MARHPYQKRLTRRAMERNRKHSLQLDRLEDRTLLSGTWNTLAATNPSSGPTNTLALMPISDGTVMVQGGSGSPTNTWYDLTPSAQGSYLGGTWSALGSMNVTRRFFPTVMLNDGRVLAVGGEYSDPTNPGTQTDNKTAEIFNPTTNNGSGSWTSVDSFPKSIFGDDPMELLPDGRVLTGGGAFNGGLGAGFNGANQTYFFDPSQPAGNQWSFAANKVARSNSFGTSYYDSSDEESWVKLSDGSILTYDIWASTDLNTFYAERFIPAGTAAAQKLGVSNTWVDASNTSKTNPPSVLSTRSQGLELGPGFLLPDGRAFFFGANGNTAYYDPATDTWSAGPAEPQKNLTLTRNVDSKGNVYYTVSSGSPTDTPTFQVATDDPGAMLPNGKILIALSPLGPRIGGGYSFPQASYVYEFDPTTNTFTENTPAGLTNENAFELNMAALPTGDVLMGNEAGSMQIYSPDGSALSSQQPSISDITRFSNSFQLTGTRLTGMSEGAAYGDDNEMASNYPIVRYIDLNGNLTRGRTFNWSNTGVQTGSTPESTQFTLPSSIGPGVYLAQVAVNGLVDSVLNILTTAGADSYTLQVDPNDSTQYQVYRDSSLWAEWPIVFSRIIVSATNSGQTVNIHNTPSGVPVTVDSATTVNIGQNGTVGGIASDVNIENPPNFTTVNVDDSADGVAHTVTLGTFTPKGDTNWGYISGLATAHINYEYADTRSVNLTTGPVAGSVINVLATGVTTNLTGKARTTVNVGNNGLIQGILGSLNIENPPSFTTLTVDDSADSGNPTATLGTFTPAGDTAFGYISGLAPANINYEYDDTSSLTLKTGAGFNTINVLATGVATNLIGTAAADGSTSDMNTVVDVGNSGFGVQQILGQVNVSNPIGFTALSIDDTADAGGRTAKIDASHVTGLAPADITYAQSDLSSLTITGGSGSNQFTVNDTPSNDLPLATTLNVGAGTANVLGTTGPLSVNGGTSVNVGNNGSVQGILGTVNIENPPSFTAITVDDSADSGNLTTTLGTFTPAGDTPWGYISGLAPANINYEYDDTSSLTLKTGVGFNTVNVLATGVTTNLIGTAVTDGSASDENTVVDVGNPSAGVQQILGQLNVSNPLGFTALSIDDTADVGGRTATIDASHVTGLAPADITYAQSDLSSVTITGGSGGNHFTVNDTPSNPLPLSTTLNVDTGTADVLKTTGPLTVNGGSLVQLGTGSTQNLNGAVTIGVAPTTLRVDDSTDNTSQTVTFDKTALAYYSITGIAPTTILYSPQNLTALVVKGSQGSNTYQIQGTAAPTTIQGGGGGSQFIVGSAANQLDPVQGPVTLSSSGGTATLTVNDTGTTTPQQWQVSASFIDRFPVMGSPPPVPQITYSHLSTVTVNTGTGQCIIGVEGTAAGTTTIVNGNGKSADLFIVDNPSDSLGNDFNGPLQIHDVNPFNLEISDATNTVAHTYTLSTGEFQRDGMQPITFDTKVGLVAVSLSRGAGSKIGVPAFAGNSFAVIVANTGNTVTIGSSASGGLSGINGDVRVQGAAGQTPQVILDDSADTTPRTIDLGSDAAFGYQAGTFGYVVSGLADTSQGRGRIGLELDPAAPVSILGGPADDDFRVRDFVGAPTLSLTAEPAGSTRSNMHNKLDYSAYKGTVKVVLPLGMATGFAGISGIQDVAGGIGNSLLVGDAQANILTGGTGRNVLIGGAGGDTLDASLSTDDNILISGTTIYDGTPNYLADLNAIFAEWTRTDLPPQSSFKTRFSDLTNGGGGVTPLNTVNGALVLLNNQTVKADGVANTLKGSTQTNPQTGQRVHNWFFYQDVLDTLLNFDPSSDHKTKVK
jgi:hypothetical protein